MRLPAGSARLGEGSALQRLGLAGLVIIAHVAGLGLLAQLASRPVLIPELTTISLALIQAEPVLAPVAPVPPAPAPSVPEPKVEKVESPPPEPPPPKPVPAPEPITKPAPKPIPKPTPKPKLTQSPSALSQIKPALEPSPEPSTEPTAAPNPAASAVTAAPARPAAAPAAVTAARFDAAYLNNPSPAYPMLSRRLREEGEVMLRVLVAADGQPKRIEVRTGSGSERLDRAAEDAVARWRFVPARRGESAVEAWVLVPIVFKLKGN